MFEVICNYPSSGDWQAQDEAIIRAALRQPSFSGVGVGPMAGCGRDLGWIVGTFSDALAMKERIECVHGVTSVRIREQVS